MRLDFGREFCPWCGHFSDHFFYPDSIVRNHKGRVLSVVVECGRAECRQDREERL